MEANLTKEQAISLGKKTLLDLGHWEKFDTQKATFISKEIDNYYDANHWIVSFNFKNGDDAFPMITIMDETSIVHSISWKTSHFILSYDREKNKYFHPRLSREQPKLK
jgi:hypothetical protein